MKKLLLSLLFISGFVVAGYAQIFSQNFATDGATSLYVDASNPGNSKFTAITVGSNTTASVTGGRLTVNKTLTSSNFATISYGGSNANLNSQVLKVKFTFTVNGTPSSGAGYTFIVGNTGVGTNNTVTTETGGAHSRFQLNYTGVAGEVTFKPVATGSASAAFSGSNVITFVVNNCGVGISYEAPNGSRESLANDKWDLWVGNTKVFNDIDADGADNTLENFKLVTVSNNVTSNVSFDDFVVTNETEPTTLPVSLNLFTAKANLQNVDLAWSTESEKDNSHFEILRSGDGKTFAKIGEVKGSGTTDAANNYTFTDKDALPGTSYYQLKQVDFNGAISLSKVEAVKSNVAASNFKVASNEQDGTVKLSVFAANEGKASFKIYDLNGRKITEQELNLTKGYSNVSLPFNGAKGLHIASLTIGSETITQKFIK